MAVRENIGTTDQLMPLFFTATNIPDAAGTAVAIEASSTDYVMPFGGYVVAITVSQNAALSTGTVTFNPTVDGTAKTALGATLTSSQQVPRATLGVDSSTAIRFSAGQKIGAKWTKTGTVSATTTDATIVVWVLLKDIAY